MPQRDYRAYAQTPKGKAARARAHARYVEKRRAGYLLRGLDTKHLSNLLTTWGNHDQRNPV